MRPYRYWKGALALDIDGIPLNVNVGFYTRTKRKRNESFRNIAPSGEPVQSQYIDPATGQSFDQDVRKGVKNNGGYLVLDDEAVEKINEGTKDAVVRPDTFCPLDSLALDLAFERYAVCSDDDDPGAAANLNVIWNGLRARKLAWISQVSLSKNGVDAILAIYATDEGMWSALLPFEDECYPTPTPAFEENDRQATAIGKHIDKVFKPKRFDHSAYSSLYKTRRESVIEAVLAGKDVAVSTPVKPKSEAPDLMAALSASVKRADKKPARKAPAKKKVAA